jgi:HlyD family secretion protein
MHKSPFTALAATLLFLFSSCGNGAMKNDAAGVFEADEVIVSSEIGGKILQLDLKEGDRLAKDSAYVRIDATNLQLQKDQVTASIAALKEKTTDANPQVLLLQNQIIVQQAQLSSQLRDQKRFENLVRDNAATQKQLDDINSAVDVTRKQIEVTKKQIDVQLNTSGTQNRSVLSEKEPLLKRAAQLQDQLDKGRVINPVAGTVLVRYAMAGEVTAPGKALYKIADLSTLVLRAYISGTQLPQVKLGQKLKVLIDDGAKNWKTYEGTITWISDKAEFTPKTIQTKEERANLVYAIKISVPNDGYLKIGMYGEVQFK